MSKGGDVRAGESLCLVWLRNFNTQRWQNLLLHKVQQTVGVNNPPLKRSAFHGRGGMHAPLVQVVY